MKINNRTIMISLAFVLVLSLIFTGTASALNVRDTASVGTSDDEIERGVAWEILNSLVFQADDLFVPGNYFTQNYTDALNNYRDYARHLLDDPGTTAEELNSMCDDMRYIIGEHSHPLNNIVYNYYTVAFTNNGGWSDPIYIYNWSDDGGETSAWPGTEMQGGYFNEYGQKQYYAYVPMDVPNIVISSNQLESTDPNYGVPCVRVQTVDIFVHGNTGYYLSGGKDGADYKVSEWELKDPVYKTFSISDPDPTQPTEKPTEAPTQKPTEAPTQKPTERPTQPIPEGDYYVVLEKDNWALKESMRLTKWSADYCSTYCDVTLTTDDRVKVAYSLDDRTVDSWYPSAEDEGYAPMYNSQYYHVEFYPYADGNYESYKGYIRATPCEPPIDDPTEYPTEEPTVFNIDDWIPRYENLEVYDGSDNSELQSSLYQLIVRVDQSILVPGNNCTPEYSEKLSRLRNFAAFVYNDRRADDNELLGAQAMLQAAIDDKSYEQIVDVMRQWFYITDVVIVPDPTTGPTEEPTSPAKHKIGDADGDGEITILDATAIQRVLALLDTNKAESVRLCGDTNNDGLDILDATAVQRYLAGFASYSYIGSTTQ